MPFSAARTFGIAGTVRLGRVQEATEEDARREGAIPMPTMRTITVSAEGIKREGLGIYAAGLKHMWDAEHPRLPWAGNPFTWIVERRKEA
jgi:hypothetical protein